MQFITYCRQGSKTSFVLLVGVIGHIVDCGLAFCDVLGLGTLVCKEENYFKASLKIQAVSFPWRILL